MKIAICDDDNREREILVQFIQKYCDANMWDAQLEEFSTGEALLGNFEPDAFNIVFLDIYMKGLSGIEVSKQVREQDENIVIIFTTSSEEFYRQGFDVGALHYLVKPVDYEKVEEALKRCVKPISSVERYIEVKMGKNNIKVRLADIQYIEVLGNASYIYTAGNKIITYTTLSELEDIIDEKSFLRCHRSFLVNMRAIVKKTSEGLLMKNGAIVPVPKNNRAKIIGQIDDYNLERMWE